MPKINHHWMSRALFKESVRGKAVLDMGRVKQLWWDPPQPSLVQNQLPCPDKYFAQRLLLWMPKKLWGIKVHCPHPECNKMELISAGIYPHVRQVRTWTVFTSWLENIWNVEGARGN